MEVCMLILTRRQGEQIIIGDNEIQVRVLSINGNKVRFGVQAPDNVEVHREEIYLKIKNSKAAENDQ